MRDELLDAPIGTGKCLLVGFGLCDAPARTGSVSEQDEPWVRESSGWDHLLGEPRFRAERHY